MNFKILLPWLSENWLCFQGVLKDISGMKWVKHRTCTIKKAVLKYFVIFTRKHLCWNLFSSLLKTDSNTSVFQWILRNLWKYLFWRTSANSCFWYLYLLRQNLENKKTFFRNDILFRFVFFNFHDGTSPTDLLQKTVNCFFWLHVLFCQTIYRWILFSQVDRWN